MRQINETENDFGSAVGDDPDGYRRRSAGGDLRMTIERALAFAPCQRVGRTAKASRMPLR